MKQETKKKILDYSLIGLLFTALNTGSIVYLSYSMIKEPNKEHIAANKEVNDKLPNVSQADKDWIIDLYLKATSTSRLDNLEGKEFWMLFAGAGLGGLSSLGFTFKLIGSKIEDKKDLTRHLKRKSVDDGRII